MSINTTATWSAHASEDAARDAVWASSLARVNMFKCLTHVDHGGEPTVLFNRVQVRALAGPLTLRLAATTMLHCRDGA